MNEKIGDSTQFWVGKKTGNDDSTTFSPINSPEVFLDTDNGGQLVLSRNPVPWKLQDVKTGNFFFGVDLYQSVPILLQRHTTDLLRPSRFLNVPLDKPLRYNNATNKLTVENPPQGELRDEFLWFARQSSSPPIVLCCGTDPCPRPQSILQTRREKPTKVRS